MFRANHKLTRNSVNILDATGDEALAALRVLDRQNLLLCPVCDQPVRVRAGVDRIEHFAHKHLADCPSHSESPEMLRARAVLYRWLRSKFNEAVTLEKVPEGIALPRHVDCWVETERTGRVAYWIVDRQMRPNDRNALVAGLGMNGVTLRVLFLAAMMQRNGKERDILNLTTTEREFLQPSDYDAGHEARPWRSRGSLHYIDPEHGVLTTYRAMGCSEEPQEYTGFEVGNSLANVRVRPSNGEFVHPGEQGRWEQFREAERLRLEEEKRRRAQEEQRHRELARQQEEARRVREEADRRQAELRRRLAENRERQAMRRAVESVADALAGGNPPVPAPQGATGPKPAQPTAPPILLLGSEREGTCIYCQRRTKDWWSYDGATGMCKCNACKGRATAGPTPA